MKNVSVVLVPLFLIREYAFTRLTVEMRVLLMVDPCVSRDADLVAIETVASKMRSLSVIFEIIRSREYFSAKPTS